MVRIISCFTDQPFQRVYQSRCEEPEKQRRQPPGNWWLIKGASGSSHPERPQEKNNQPEQSKPGMNTEYWQDVNIIIESSITFS